MTSVLDEVTSNTLSDFSSSVFRARQTNKAKPLLSLSHPQLNESEAYFAQGEYVKLVTEVDKISGFKAALATATGQKRLNTSGPVSGVLFRSGQYADTDTLKISDFVRPVLETEIGFRVAKSIQPAHPPANTDELKNYIATVFPIVEVADTGFIERPSMAPDLIAANSASAAYIFSAADSKLTSQRSDELNLDEVKITFYQNGKEIGSGKGKDTMAGQWQAVSWLVDQILQQGYEINPGAILMTGALGSVYPASVGEYEADYGEFGKVRFSFV